jgi:DNA-binding NarL/FixJ family response regulator
MGGFNPGAERARVLIADEVELFRRGLRDVLAKDGRFIVAAETGRSEDVPAIYERVRPDVTLVSASSRGALETTPLDRIRRSDRGARVIVLIAPEAADQVVRFIQAGAQGVLLRDASADAILAALHDVCEGGSGLDARLARLLFDSLAGGGSRLGDTQMQSSGLDPAVLSLLSQREREVLQALAQGYRNKEIGAALGVSVGTVKTHLRHIFRKLQVADRTGAVLKAVDARLRRAA